MRRTTEHSTKENCRSKDPLIVEKEDDWRCLRPLNSCHEPDSAVTVISRRVLYAIEKRRTGE